MPNKKLGFVFSLALLLGALLFSLWRSQFGIEIYDEPNFLVSGFKTYALGDLPFRDEIYNSARHFDIFLNQFIRPWLPYSVLNYRRAAVLVYFVLLVSSAVLLFKTAWNPLLLFSLLACFLYDPFLTPTWSYNWLVRDLLLLHLLAWTIALRSTSRAPQAFSYLMAGVALGCLGVCYNTLFLTLFGAMALVFGGRRLFQWEPCPTRHAYWIGGALVVLAHAIYLYPLRTTWLLSLQALATLPEYSANLSPWKTWNNLLAIVGQKEFWLACGLLAWPRLPRLPKPVAYGAMALALFFIAKKWLNLDDSLRIHHGLMAITAGVSLACLASFKRATPWIVPIAVPWIAALLMGQSSVNGGWSMLWCLPAALLPALFLLREQLTKARLVWAAYAAVLPCAAIYHLWSQSYRDVAPRHCTTRLTSAPLTGIYTSERRAYLLEKIHDLVKDEKFVFAFHRLPGVFYYGEVRSALDSINGDLDFPRGIAERSLRRMLEGNRLPTLVLREKDHHWNWGLPNRHWIGYPATHPFSVFTECVRSEQVADYVEFEAFKVDPARTPECVERALQIHVSRASR